MDNQALTLCLQTAKDAGVPQDQAQKFIECGYVPLPWQWKFHAAAREADLDNGPIDIGAGGARGPGKSHAVLSQAGIDDCQRVPGLKGLFLRQTGISAKESFEDLVDKTLKGKVSYEKTGSLLKFPNDSRILLGGFHDEKDIDKYIGIEYDFIIVEELNQLTEDKYDKLRGSLRTSKSNWRPRMYTSFNPGGLGHSFVKKRYVTPFRKKEQKTTRFIPSTYKSNVYLNKEYIEYLEGLEGDLGKAWREGEWELFAGQVFHEWRYSTHVIKPVVPTKDATHVLWMDWGYAVTSAFACYLSAIVPFTTSDGQKYNQIVTYKEWYGNQIQPKQWARRIYEDCEQIGIVPDYGVSDPATHSPLQSGDQSISSMFESEWNALNDGFWLRFKSGSNSGRNSRVNRVGMMHEWMSINPMSKLPYWVVTESCPNFIETVPELVHDTNLVEAYDTSQVDHAADACSYGLEKIRFTSVRAGAHTYGGVEPVRKQYNAKSQELSINPVDFSNLYPKR